MKKIFLFAMFLCPVLFSCHKDEIRIDPDNLLIGVWNWKRYAENATVYTRQREFTAYPCFKFNDDGTLIERKNAGWCGTPPVSYADYGGTWTILNDTLVSISVGYWGGTTNYRIDIESVSKDSLKVIMIYDSK
jgi:hypothetical protein